MKAFAGRLSAVGCVAAVAGLAAACDREARRFTDSPTRLAAEPQSTLRPGPTMTSDTIVVASASSRSATQVPTEKGRYDDNAWGAAEGKRLFNQMNCSGCHSNGGGGIGPALIDDEWLYGSDPASIYETIVAGRPSGMPAFRDRLAPQQVWQLVAYVRSMSGLTPKGARPGRVDHMMMKPAEQQTPNARPRLTKPPYAPPSP
jgi:cytochrome c oxidase cbb3-type subunit III